MLSHLDAARAEEGRILAGPTANFDAWMTALRRLEDALAFLSQHRLGLANLLHLDGYELANFHCIDYEIAKSAAARMVSLRYVANRSA